MYPRSILTALLLAACAPQLTPQTDLDQTVIIADSFAQHLAAHRDASWARAEVAEVVPLLDRQLELTGHEVTFTGADGEWLGGVVVSALDDTAPVVYYSLGTPLTVAAQQARVRRTGEELALGDASFVVGVGPYVGLIDGDTAPGEVLRDGYLPAPLDDFLDNAEVEVLVGEDAEQAQRARELLLAGDLRAFADERSPEAMGARSGTVASGASSFPTWSQETLDWTTYGSTTVGTCPAGCSPLAAMTLVHYWDGDGSYNRLIGGSSKPSAHPSLVSNKRVRKGIARLQNYGGSYCSGGITWTNTMDADTALDTYINTWAGYSFSVDNDVNSKWSKLMTSIDKGNPVVMHFGTYSGGAGHSVLAYEYTDKSFKSNDWACFKVGNGSSYGCWNKSWSGWTWTRQTKAQP